MTAIHVRWLESLDELRSAAAAWDDLWLRSPVTSPTARAELVAQWTEQFEPKAPFRALCLEQGGQFVAALPLVESRLGGVLAEGSLTGNAWSPCGELLLDLAHAPQSAPALIDAIAALPLEWLWLDNIPIDGAHWQALTQAGGAAGVGMNLCPRFDVGRLSIDHDWPGYTASLSRNHRQAMNKALRRLEKAGTLRLNHQTDLPVDDIEPHLFEGFSVEDRSWKGRAGSSVMQTPGMYTMFVRQAQQLAAWGQLELATLELDDHTIAFLYGYRAKGVLHAHKIGYDPAFAEFSPGQVMFHQLFERLHADPTCQSVDFVGPLTHSTSRWRPASYRLGRLVVAPRRLLGRAALYAYKNWWPRLKRLTQSHTG